MTDEQEEEDLYISERAERTLMAVVKHGNLSRAGQEAGLRPPGKPHYAENARRDAARVLKNKTVQQYFWEQMDEAGLCLQDIIAEQKRIIFEAELKVYDYKTQEVVSLGPDNHERNIGIANILRTIGIFASAKHQTKEKKKVVINWGVQEVNVQNSDVINVTPQEVVTLFEGQILQELGPDE